jgi:diaminopimelate epimerase
MHSGLKTIPFTKMSGVGNDFIVIDNRLGALDGVDVPEFARRVCRRRMSLGGDELMIIEAAKIEGFDFAMRTINPDGREVEMCGNAARCVARFAYINGIAGVRMRIETQGGPVTAQVDGEEVRVRLQITASPILDRRLIIDGVEYRLDSIAISGVPQAVVFFDEIEKAPDEHIRYLGAAIRRHPDFPNGTNTNFIQVVDKHSLWQRTYERGVEGETLACGTGAAASSMICARRGLVDSPVRINVLGGALSVWFERDNNGEITDLYLGGGTRFVAEGKLHPEAWDYGGNST